MSQTRLTLRRSFRESPSRMKRLRTGPCEGSTTAPSILLRLLLETAFDEAWLTLKSIGNATVKPDELARCVLRLATEGERDPVRLHDGALKGLILATAWREAS